MTIIISTSASPARWYYSTRCESCGLNLLAEQVTCEDGETYERAECPNCGELNYGREPWR